MSRVLPWALAIASGALLGLCYPPWGLGNLCWVALTPLVWAIWFTEPPVRRPWVQRAALGYVCGIVFFAMSASWLTTLTWPGFLLLVLYFAGYFSAWTLLAWFVACPGAPERWLSSLHNLRVCLVAAAGWVALEWLRGIIFPAFGWNGLGIALYKNIPLIQIADITGTGGISFLVAMANLMLAATVKRVAMEIGGNRRRPHLDFSLTVALIALVWGYGVRQFLAEPPESTELTFAAVQANIPQNIRNDPSFSLEILETYRRQTMVAIAMQPDLILWPESATPAPLLGDQLTWDLVRGLAEQHSGDLLLGTVHWAREGDFNSIALLTERGTQAQLYHKIHLVPFGEYVPLREEFPLLAAIVGDLVPDDFDAGKEFEILEMNAAQAKLAPLICFEDTVGNLARRFAQKGAQAFVVGTNDGWFLESAGSMQHLQNAVFRCVETKLPMIRAANTGVTCAIDRLGNVREVLRDDTGSTFTQGVLFSRIALPSEPTQTFYTRHGEVFSISCLSLAALALVGGLLRRKFQKSSCPKPRDTKPSAA